MKEEIEDEECPLWTFFHEKNIISVYVTCNRCVECDNCGVSSHRLTPKCETCFICLEREFEQHRNKFPEELSFIVKLMLRGR